MAKSVLPRSKIEVPMPPGAKLPADVDDEITRIELHPAISELVSLLPLPGHGWPIADRLLWLRAFAAVADLVYGHDPEQAVAITPEVGNGRDGPG